MNIYSKIKELFLTQSEWTVRELTDKLGVSKQSIHTVLNKMVLDGDIQKFGRVPRTFYKRLEKNVLREGQPVYFTKEVVDFMHHNFLAISELGNLQIGLKGFEIWCQKRNVPFEKTVAEFMETKKKYLGYFNGKPWIEGTQKLKNTTSFECIYLDEIYYLDFYAIERFGKSKLGTLLHFAKQGQNKFLMNMLLEEVQPLIQLFLEANDFDAVCFVPPTLRREVQIMKFIENYLNLNLPKVEILKVSGMIAVPQKSLSKIEERINNANYTFSLPEKRKFNHILIIDDAVGSGATINQIAKKIKEKKLATKVTGMAIVGSFKGFDVITDI